MKKAVIGIVEFRPEAEAILDELHEAGFQPSDISVLFPDTNETRSFAHEHKTKAPEGAAAGATAGGALGGMTGLLVGLGTLAIPGLGPFIAAGPLLAALSGAAAGATVGGLTGVLIGMGIPEYEAKIYEGKLRHGKLLISVHVDDNAEEKAARAVFDRHRTDDVSTKTETSIPKEKEDRPE